VATTAVALGIAFGVTASSASAYSANFCGIVIPSQYPPPWPCYSPFAGISYASSSYSGGGCIDDIYAGLSGGGGYTSAAHGCYTNNFTNICHYPIAAQYGRSAQYEFSGASHTINGRIDDSPNHTGCV
jgi:hypothetical protein